MSQGAGECSLTPRSTGEPTAGHQARPGGTRYIFASPGLASCRCLPVSSNVRQRQVRSESLLNTARPRGLALPKPLFLFGSPRRPRTSSRTPEAASPPGARTRQQCLPFNSVRQRLIPARGRAEQPPVVFGAVRHHCSPLPNPSLNRRANGRPPGPGLWHMVHHHSPGPGVLPLSPG